MNSGLTDEERSAYSVDSHRVAGLRVELVADAVARNAVCNLRHAGYRGLFKSPTDAWDRWDDMANARVLLFMDQQGTPVGTVRLMESSRGPIELSDYVPGYGSHFSEGSSFVEGARLVAARDGSVTKHTVQAAIWKATYLYGKARDTDFIIVWSKRGPERGYRYLCFSELPASAFAHAGLGGKQHSIFTLDIERASSILGCRNHPLTQFFFDDAHPNLHWFSAGVGAAP